MTTAATTTEVTAMTTAATTAKSWWWYPVEIHMRPNRKLPAKLYEETIVPIYECARKLPDDFDGKTTATLI